MPISIVSLQRAQCIVELSVSQLREVSERTGTGEEKLKEEETKWKNQLSIDKETREFRRSDCVATSNTEVCINY